MSDLVQPLIALGIQHLNAQMHAKPLLVAWFAAGLVVTLQGDLGGNSQSCKAADMFKDCRWRGCEWKEIAEPLQEFQLDQEADARRGLPIPAKDQDFLLRAGCVYRAEFLWAELGFKTRIGGFFQSTHGSC